MMCDQNLVSFDDNGKVAASRHLITVLPWVLMKSKKYEGRYYFYNQETKRSEWTLEKHLILGSSLTVSSFDSAVTHHNVNNICGPPASPQHQPTTGMFPKLMNRNKLKASAPKKLLRSNSVEIKRHTRTNLRYYSQEGDDDGEDELVPLSKIYEKQKYQVVGGLGLGGFAVVVKVEIVPNNIGASVPFSTLEQPLVQKTYAMKVIPKMKAISTQMLVCNDKDNGNVAEVVDDNDDEGFKNRLNIELSVMMKINKTCPFLQHCYDCFESVSNVFIISNINEGGDLFTHLTHRMETTGRSFKEIEAKILLAEIYLGLKHLHDHNFIHGDLKIENIMLDSNGHVKLIDFGLSVRLEQYDELQPMKPRGSLIYMAPELLNDKIGGRCTDWWAYGVVAYTLLTGHCPWSSFSNRKKIISEIGMKEIVFLPMDYEYSRESKIFVNSFMRKDVDKRLGTISEEKIKCNHFFQKHIHWERMLKLKTLPAFKPPNISVQEITTSSRDGGGGRGGGGESHMAHKTETDIVNSSCDNTADDWVKELRVLQSTALEKYNALMETTTNEIEESFSFGFKPSHLCLV